MQYHEKKAFLKFFITYFLSVAVLILIAGHFYYEQMRDQYMKMEEFSLIEYARHIKLGGGLGEFSDDYHHTFVENDDTHINIRNFSVLKDELMKYIPTKHNDRYLQVFKSRDDLDAKLFDLRLKTIFTQIFLLFFFALLSLRLSKNALRPLRESITTLDRFAKDLIHDLNTPVTSVKLNMRLLEKEPGLKDINAFIRLNKSVHNISELHDNLTILLQEETFQMQMIDVCEIVKDAVQIQRPLFPHLDFHIDCSLFKARLNAQAIRQILQNIISNACKYSHENGSIKIYAKGNSLYVEDNGKGIKEPEKIFERAYSTGHSSGIGLDIVKRLAEAMEIKIAVKSDDEGTIFILTMR